MRVLKRLRKAGGAAVSFLCVGALVAAQGVPAYAAGMSKYEAPASPTPINKNYVTIGTHNTGSQGEMLGLTDVTFSTFQMVAGVDVSTNDQLGLFGTDLNSSKSQYWANYFYNTAVDDAKKLGSSDVALVSGMQKPDSADASGVAEFGGVSNTIYHRPDILMGCDPNNRAEGNAIVLKSSSTPVSVARASVATSGYTDQVELVNSLEKGSTYYQDGDEAYDPYYVEFTTFYGDAIDGDKTCGAYSLYTAVTNMYRLATAAEGVLAADSTKVTRYGDPMEIAQSYEAYLRGLQLDVLSAIDAKKTTKKSVAIVDSIDTEAKTATLYKSTEAGSVECGDGSTSDISGAAEILENVCDNIAGTHASGGAWTATVSAADLMKADSIILSSASAEASLKSLLSDGGYTDESAYPDIFTTATGLSDSWGNSGSVSNVGLYLGFVYPEVVNPVYALAYSLVNFWHVKSDATTLSNVLGYLTQGVSLPEGVSADVSGYSDAAVDKAIQTGLWYYAQNKAAIDKSNPKLSVSSNVTLPTSDPNAVVNPGTTPGNSTPKATSVTKGGVTYTISGKVAQVTKVAKSKKSVTIKKSVKIGSKTYKVSKVKAKVFKGTKVTKVTVKSTTLKKASVKNSLKGSKVKTVKVPKAKRAAYKKIFKKANSGKKVTVK